MTFELHFFELTFWMMISFVIGFVSFGLMNDRS